MALSWDAVESNRLVEWLNSASEATLGWKVPAALSMYRPGGPSHLPALAVFVALYFVAVFLVQKALRRTKSGLRNNVWFTRYSFWHNVFMSLLSLYMFVDVVVKLYQLGCLTSFDKYMAVGPSPAFFAVNDLFYWSKFLELIDTFILLGPQKELGVLHLFHHATTASVAYVARMHPLWMGTWTNGLVHVFMYAHFARPISFVRQSLTTLQIVQFIFVLVTYQLWWLRHSDLPFTALLWPNFCYTVYLVFFCQFFYDNYISKKPKTTPKLVANKKAQ